MHVVFVEKILRVQPKVKRLYLLVRASDNESATQRFREEVSQLSIFNSLIKKMNAPNYILVFSFYMLHDLFNLERNVKYTFTFGKIVILILNVKKLK